MSGKKKSKKGKSFKGTFAAFVAPVTNITDELLKNRKLYPGKRWIK